MYENYPEQPAPDGKKINVRNPTANTATAHLSVSARPGDNFKVTATNWTLTDNALTQQIVDREGIGANVLPKDAKITELLTTWRTLHIEPDSMGDEGEEGPFDEAGPFTWRVDPNVIWDWFPENIGENGNTNAIFREPSLAFLTEQMARCYVEVQTDLESYDTTDQLSFTRNLKGGVQASVDEINTVRDVPSRANFWVIQVFSAYDGGSGADLDTFNGDFIYLAWTPQADPGEGDLMAPAVLNLETLRDKFANTTHVDPPVAGLQGPQVYIGRAVLHEVVHRFGMPRGDPRWDTGILNVDNLFKDDADNALTPMQINMIRTWKRP